MDICHSPDSGTPGAPLRLKSSTPRSGFVQQITGANADGPRQLAMQTRWAARVAQFWRSARNAA